jgi:hypothetical protein
MTSDNVSEPGIVETASPMPGKPMDDHLIDELVDRARAPRGCS